MGYFNKGFNPTLVTLATPRGDGVQKASQALMSFADDKIAQSKESALKKEKEAKEAAMLSAQIGKNWVRNPQASKALMQIYGIEEGSALASADAPTKANAALGSMDLGKADKPEKATSVHSYKGEDGFYYSTMSDGSTVKSSQPYKKTTDPLKPEHSTVNIDGQNYHALYNPKTKRWESTGDLAYKNETRSVTSKPKDVPFDTLSMSQKQYLMKNRVPVRRDKNGQAIVSTSQLEGFIQPTVPSRKEMVDIGNLEVQ